MLPISLKIDMRQLHRNTNNLCFTDFVHHTHLHSIPFFVCGKCPISRTRDVAIKTPTVLWKYIIHLRVNQYITQPWAAVNSPCSCVISILSLPSTPLPPSLLVYLNFLSTNRSIWNQNTIANQSTQILCSFMYTDLKC